MKLGLGGRPTLLQREGITLDDLEQDYLELGSYRRVGEKYGVTERTIQNHIGKGGARPTGRKRGSYTSKTRAFIESNPELLRLSGTDVVSMARNRNLSPTYVRTILREKKLAVENAIIEHVRREIRENVAILDTKRRHIPTAAIKYVWIPKWHWDRPVYIKYILRDGHRGKLPTMYTPRPETIISPSVSSDRSPETS